MIDSIVAWLSQYAENNKRPTLVVGVSGGIDSAVTSTLCAKTGLKTIAVIMRIKTHDPLSTTQTNWLTHHFENVTVIIVSVGNTILKTKTKIKSLHFANITILFYAGYFAKGDNNITIASLLLRKKVKRF